MTFYEELVMQTQMNFSKYYGMYASGKTPYILTEKKPLPYPEQISRLVRELNEAECIVVGGASGLSAAGGGDFYYEDNASYRKYFWKFAEKGRICGNAVSVSVKRGALGICGDLSEHNAERAGAGAVSGSGPDACGKRFLHTDDQSGYSVREALSGGKGQ